ncbi:uncharacterized protein LOC114253118 [Bombyx mandarina]|uniref:Uncharacterized protein n=2 Tax=Bombyx TaxID=7090 RepID=A0A8R2AQD5_BOMMO|nr:uncharacterized protein LOC101738974 [Bombyx mori]XP_012545783.1 uncharacterized protein LOC101738974 [Bombyx mori]XP_028043679.1 uncharacterized protein LOC114253118 [Bombyx mandarina]
MTRLSIIAIVLCQILCLQIQGGHTEDDNPLLDIASSLLQNMGNGDNNGNGMAAIGSIIGNLMQGDNVKNLASLFNNEKEEKEKDSGNIGDILSGLGSLMGGQDGKIDPAMIGGMISMFASMGSTPKREKREQKKEITFDNLMNLASSFTQNKEGGSYMPLIMSALKGFTKMEADKKADEHKDHASFLPPYLEKAHLYWDIFINSEVGKLVWEKTGMKKMFKAFTGPDGKISFETMFKNFENTSFRRHWIKASAKYLTDMAVHVTKPEVYRRYISMAEYVINSFMESQGFPNSIQFNAKAPAKSLTAIINYLLKTYMDFDADVTEYVVPAVEYAKQTLKLAEKAAQSVATREDYAAVSDRLTDALNLEVIEPVLRVYRAYRHSAAAPHCQEHLMCLVNRPEGDRKGAPGLKAGLTKLSSLVASAALSFHDGKGFWDLYNAIQSDVNCEAAYPADCSAFHEHELRVTTEPYHTEL